MLSTYMSVNDLHALTTVIINTLNNILSLSFRSSVYSGRNYKTMEQLLYYKYTKTSTGKLR